VLGDMLGEPGPGPPSGHATVPDNLGASQVGMIIDETASDFSSNTWAGRDVEGSTSRRVFTAGAAFPHFGVYHPFAPRFYLLVTPSPGAVRARDATHVS